MTGFKNCIAYVGTYTSGESVGIYTFKLEENGKLAQIRTQELSNPSYLSISRNKEYLYAVIEGENFEGNHGGGAAAFKIDKKSGELRILNSKGTKGVAPCHLITDKNDKQLYVANYMEGTFTAFDISEDGSIGELKNVIEHEGKGQDVNRQEKAHVHYVNFSQDEKYLFVVDLGIDKIKIYSIDQEKRGIALAGEFAVKPGSGPRHLEFHPTNKYAYLINELSSNIAVLRYCDKGTILETIQYIATLPKGYSGFNNCAAIHISRDGRFLYASNRGHNSIASFKIDEETGTLELNEIIPTEGEFPRDFEIDPSGRFLFAANQNSSTITAFEINNSTGGLVSLGHIISVPNPTCIKFYEI